VGLRQSILKHHTLPNIRIRTPIFPSAEISLVGHSILPQCSYRAVKKNVGCCKVCESPFLSGGCERAKEGSGEVVPETTTDFSYSDVPEGGA
jgi:hypothetical protein